jgi:hypothetical protein
MQLLLRKREFESLRAVIYLPLDSIIIQKLRRREFKLLNSEPLVRIKKRLNGKKAYELSYKTYLEIQDNLIPFLKDLNKALPDFKLKNRIDLNILWSMN